MADPIYTIGHSTHSLEVFIDLLKRHEVTAVCDVRSHPYSRISPQFNRETIRRALQQEGIKYVFLGYELGARSKDRACYRDGQVQYDLLAQTEAFKDGIARVKDGSKAFRVVLMCAEKEPLECHRAILVSRTLDEAHVPVKHILSNGQIEDHHHAIQRLIGLLHIPEGDMFRTAMDTMVEAYSRQSTQIAYREQVVPNSEASDTE